MISCFRGCSWSGESWERGGASVWTTGSYDPETNLVFYGTGNPGPDFYGDDRKVIMLANRNGFFYTLDRTTGKVIVAKPFVTTTWAQEVGADGRPVLSPGHTPNEQGATTCPDISGGTNFNPPSYDPALRLFFVNACEVCATYYGWKSDFKPGQVYTGGSSARPQGLERPFGAVRAIDPATGERKWEFRYANPTLAGVLSTASGLVFSVDDAGNLLALDARSGKLLWGFQLGSPLWGTSPTTYMLDGRQYVVAPAGGSLIAFALPREVRLPR